MQFRRLNFFFYLLLIILSSTNFTFLKDKPTFSYKIYGNIASYFVDERELLDLFNIRKGNVVAEVGAGNGQNIVGLSLLTDSVTYYAQDIDPKVLTQNNFEKLIKKSKKYKDPNTCKFYLKLGTERASELPDNSFDKIILSATFHEFTYIDEMLTDIHKKLRAGGKLYVLESKCLSKTHRNYSSDECIAFCTKHNFKFLKKDGKDLNGSTGLYRLIFEK
jgi:ubiquinone/menaquinone biosynthesis C-methylase UbiE